MARAPKKKPEVETVRPPTKLRGRKTPNIPAHASQQDMAAILGITDRRVRQLTDEGVLPKAANGKYRLAKTVQAFAAYGRNLEKQKVQSANADTFREAKEAEVRQRMARQDLVLIETAEAVEVVDAICAAFVSKIAGIPSRVTKDLRDRTKLSEVCDEVQNELATRFEEIAGSLSSGRITGPDEGEDGAGPVGEGEPGISS